MIRWTEPSMPRSQSSPAPPPRRSDRERCFRILREMAVGYGPELFERPRFPWAIARKRDFCLAAYGRGIPQRYIAEFLGVHRTTVLHHVKVGSHAA